MGEILVKDKEVVAPGQELAQGLDFVPGRGAFREGEKIIASLVGLVSVNGRLIKLIPLNGFYSPKRGDTVIARIIEINLSGWSADIGIVSNAFLTLKEASNEFIPKDADLTTYFNYGDMLVAKISKFSKPKFIDLTMRDVGLRKLTEGRIIHVIPQKVPRIIGKQGSMISMIKTKTNCKILVGQNGIIWLSGKDIEGEMLAIETIRKIEKEAHTEGLTESINKFLEERTKKNV